MSRSKWRTRFGFYFAAIGSAVGLGNLWRFPYVVGENGGGAFVLLYIFVILAVGLPLLVGELALGKTTRKGVVSTMSVRHGKGSLPFRLVGKASIALTIIILAYYTIISGWVLHFLIHFLLDVIGVRATHVGDQVAMLLSSGWLQLLLGSVNILISVMVVGRGVQEGMERWIGYTMPAFILLLIVLVGKSLSLETSQDALRFLFYPRFENLSLASLNFAIGHALFTLSVGMGMMLTFGGYLKDQDHAPTAGFRVALADMAISGLAGLLVFPIALNASHIPLTDPTLMFGALVDFFHKTQGGRVFGFAFFLCLYVAAIGASVGLLEVGVADSVERRKVKRTKAATQIGIVILALAVVPAMSGSILQNVEFEGRGLLEWVDLILINGLLPILAIGLSLSIGKILTNQEMEEAFIDKNRIESVALFSTWKWALKWFVPGLIALSLVLSIYQALR